MSAMAYAVLTLLLAAADQLIKALVRRAPVGSALFELPGIVRVTHRSNTGAAFSLFSGKAALLALASAALMALVVWLFLRAMHPSRPAKLALAALLGGGIGNLVDRVLFGSVTDYIQTLFVDFPVFNFADICVTVSVGVLLLLLATGRLEERG